jgi:hypothetical protein
MQTTVPWSPIGVGVPSGPTTSRRNSPAFFEQRSLVVLPTAWMISVIVPP